MSDQEVILGALPFNITRDRASNLLSRPMSRASRFSGINIRHLFIFIVIYIFSICGRMGSNFIAEKD